MAANGISELATKEARQLAKLDIAQAKRQGKTVATDGTITGDKDSSKPYYRNNNVYDIDSLPKKYSDNASVDNPNSTGLLVGRPWVGVEVIAAPTTIEEALPAATLIELESWYDAADSNYFIPNQPDDGDTFTQWIDKSDYAHNANPIGGALTRASYQTNELNSLSVVRFDGNDGLSINPYSSLSGVSGLTVFAVLKMTGATGNPRIFSVNSGATEFYYDSTAGRFALESSGGIGTSTVANDNSAFHIHTYSFDGTGVDNASRLKYRYDKTDITLTFSGTVGTNLGTTGLVFYIGNNNGANFYTGDIAEFLIFTHALSSIEIQNVENYLSTKWNL